MKALKLFLPVVLGLFFYSCKDEYTICDLSKTVNFRAVFYKKSSGTESAYTVPSFSLKLLNYPDFLYKNLPNVNQFSLAFNPSSDSIRYAIGVSPNGITDTITINYTTQTVNLSAVCGDIQVNNITRVSTTKNLLDSIKIATPAVNTTEVENIKIYVHQ